MKIDKCEKLVGSFHNKKKKFIHIKALNQTLDYGLLLIKVQRVIAFSQQTWLKPYNDMNTELRRKAKNDFENNIFKLMNNFAFGKTMEKVKTYRNINS